MVAVKTDTPAPAPAGAPTRKQRTPGTDEEIAYVRKHYANLGPTAVAKQLDRPIGSVGNIAKRMGLSAENRRERIARMDKMIRNRYPTEGAPPIARALGCDIETIWYRANKIGVKRGIGPHQKLSERDVAQIKRRLAEGSKQSDLAREYHVTRAAISAIATGKAWAAVPKEGHRG